ncbi:MAG TPA: type IV pilus assembly protein PilM [Candidatus Paceibacterota bacterium]
MQNPFSKLIEKFGDEIDFFKREPASVIGVDVGSSAIKVVQLRREHGVAKLDTYGEIALGPYANRAIGQAVTLKTDQLVQALVDVMREANVTSKTGGISIPFTSSLVTMIRMPGLPQKQLEKMIPLEARKYIPVPVNEVSLDWFILPEREEDTLPEHGEDRAVFKKTHASAPPQTNILLVAIHNDVLNMYQSIVTKAHLDIDFFEIEIFSSIRATVGQTLAPVGVLDIGAAKTKLYVVEYGIVKMSHLINQGAQDLTLSLSRALSLSVEKAEEQKRLEGLITDDVTAIEALRLPLDRILSEVNRVFLSYERKYNRNISRVVLTGGGSVLKGLLPLAKEKLETDVVLGDPFAKTDAPAFLEDILKQVGPEFSVAVGLALRKLQASE